MSVAGAMPVTVAAPVIASALILAVHRWLPRRAFDLIALAGTTVTAAVAVTVLAESTSGRVVAWAGGWLPVDGRSVGIVLVADPVGAGAAVLASAVTAAALLFSWRYIDSDEGHFHCLVLLFLAGMEGFALTGDLFDMFVFFELMGAAAYALTGMKVEDPGSLHGGMSFGIINSLGAYIALMGLGLLYGHTGQLGLAQLGAALTGERRSALVVAACVMLLTAFLVKGAVFPFHFWLADAHAVAPSPVCAMFSGVMVPLGLYGAFRVYWTVFSGVIPAQDVERAFLVLGAVTALLGSVMCLAQRNFKRLLAYSTIAHVGLFTVALGLLTPSGTAGAAIYVLGHAGAKAALFLIAGIVLARYGSVDEAHLHGRGRDAGAVRYLAVLGGLVLACLPPFGTALGKSIAEAAGSATGRAWMPALFVAVSAVTGGAVLRVVGRVFFGLGPRPAPPEAPPGRPAAPPVGGEGPSDGEEGREGRPLDRVPLTMLVAVTALLAGALAVGVVPGLAGGAGRAAAWFGDPGGYRRAALAPAAAVPGPTRVPGSIGWTAEGAALGMASAVLALMVAAAGIWAEPAKRYLAVRAGAGLLRSAVAAGRRPLRAVQALHSGHIGDYVAWMMVGVALLGAFVGLPGR